MGNTHVVTRDNGILVVVDPQVKLHPKVFESGRVTHNCVLLLRFARLVGFPVVVTTQYEKGLGALIPEIGSEIGDGSPLDKVHFGCFGSKSFVDRIGRFDPSSDTLLLCGIESHICVAQTALGALDRGYHVHVASDAVSSRTQWNWKIGLDRMREAGATISSTEMIMYEVLGRSDAPEFKEILPYVRDPAPWAKG